MRKGSFEIILNEHLGRFEDFCTLRAEMARFLLLTYGLGIDTFIQSGDY
jgi:hypothetical protein